MRSKRPGPVLAPDLIGRLRARLSARPMHALIDLEIVDLELDLCRMALDFNERFDNGGGAIHGGILAMLADTAVACALSTNFDGKMGFATSSMNIHFLEKARTRVVATARIIKKGSRVCVGTVEIEDEKGSLVAKAICDFVLTTSKFE